MVLTISLLVQQNLWVSLSNVGLIAPAITVCVVVIAIIVYASSKKTKRLPLPPMVQHGFITVIKGMKTFF